MYIYKYTYIYTYEKHIYVYIYIWIYIFIYINIYIYTHVSEHIYVHILIYIYTRSHVCKAKKDRNKLISEREQIKSHWSETRFRLSKWKRRPIYTTDVTHIYDNSDVYLRQMWRIYIKKESPRKRVTFERDACRLSNEKRDLYIRHNKIEEARSTGARKTLETLEGDACRLSNDKGDLYIS